MGIKSKTYFFIFLILFFEISTPLARGKNPFGICKSITSRIGSTIGARLEKSKEVKKDQPINLEVQPLFFLIGISFGLWKLYTYSQYRKLALKEDNKFQRKIAQFIMYKNTLNPNNATLEEDELEKLFYSALNNKYPIVRQHAIRKIFEIINECDDKKIKKLLSRFHALIIQGLRDKDRDVRESIIHSLIYSVSKTDTDSIQIFLPQIIRGLMDSDPLIRYECLHDLNIFITESNDIALIKKTIPVITEKLNDTDPEVRALTISTLQDFVSKTKDKYLIKETIFQMKRRDVIEEDWDVKMELDRVINRLTHYSFL